MIRTLRITSILAVALAAILVVFSVVFGVRSDKDIEKLLSEPDVIEKFSKSTGNKGTRGESQVSPLVQQAGVFALYLNPPQPKVSRPVTGRTTSVIPGPSVTPKFKVLATSYCKNHPELSMVLIDEPGKGSNWIRQSGTVGHLLIEEVKDGIVVLKDNNGTFELAAEQKPQISLLEGAPGINSKGAGISSSTAQRTGLNPAASASVNSSASSGKADSRSAKLPRPPLPRKTNEEESAMTELSEKLARLQKSFKSYNDGSGPTPQEKAEMMSKLISEFKASKSSRLSAEETERLSILGKELKKVIEEPTSSGEK